MEEVGSLLGFQSVQALVAMFFFSFVSCFFVFSILIFIMRLRACCNCQICQSFMSSSWTKDFYNLCDWYTHLLRKSPTGTVHVHVLGNVITANPDNIEYILKTRFDNFPKGKPFSTILGDLLGRGIFNVDGDLWKFQRKIASLELGSVSVRSYAFEIATSEIRRRLIPLLTFSAAASAKGEESELDLQDVFRRFSFDNICRFSFGLDPGCLEPSLPVSEAAEAFDLASNLSAARAMTASPIIWKIKRFLNIGSEKKLKEAIKSVNKLADDVIKQRRQMVGSSSSSPPNDLLSRFIAATIDDNDDDRFLRDIIISFLLAGRDTVASALTSFFWLLTQYPEVESAIMAESDRVMGCPQPHLHDQDVPSFEQLREMHYLQAALYESMRLYPPVQFDSKFCQDDDVLPDGTFVEKGTRVTYHPYAMGRMENVWGSDCLHFNPDRWLHDGVFQSHSPFKYPVFQAGPRVCLGKEMAIVQMKTVAVSLIRRFHIRVLTSTQAPPRFAPGLTATVRGGLPVVVTNRSETTAN